MRRKLDEERNQFFTFRPFILTFIIRKVYTLIRKQLINLENNFKIKFYQVFFDVIGGNSVKLLTTTR